MMAAVLAVTRARALSMSIMLSGPQSHSTGSAPTSCTAAAVAMKVWLGRITS